MAIPAASTDNDFFLKFTAYDATFGLGRACSRAGLHLLQKAFKMALQAVELAVMNMRDWRDIVKNKNNNSSSLQILCFEVSSKI